MSKRRRPLIRRAPLLVCLSLSLTINISASSSSSTRHQRSYQKFKPPPYPTPSSTGHSRDEKPMERGVGVAQKVTGKRMIIRDLAAGVLSKCQLSVLSLSLLLVLDDLKVLKFLKDISIYEKMKYRVFCRRL